MKFNGKFLIISSLLFYYSYKSGKVVIVLSGRFAGRKAIVVRASDEGTDAKKYGHAVGRPCYSIPLDI